MDIAHAHGAHHGLIYLIVTHRTKPATDGFSNGCGQAFLNGVFEAVAADLRSRGSLDFREAFIDGSFALAKKGIQGREDEA